MWLTSSMQAIATRRCPSLGSSPVVSVWSTNPRMPSPPPPRQTLVRSRRHSDDLGESTQGEAAAAPCRHDETGAPALVALRHLLGENGVQTGCAHPRPCADACALKQFRRADHDDDVQA